MTHSRTVRIDIDTATNLLHVVGTELNIHLSRCAPPGSRFFSVKCTPDVQYSITPQPSVASHLSPLPLHANQVLLIGMKKASAHENDNKLSVRYYGEKSEVLGNAVVHLTAVEISLDVDADRDGKVEKDNPNKDSWKWGPNGHGAILLVNCDSEQHYWKKPDLEKRTITKVSDLKDMSLMILRTRGPAKLPDGYKLSMHITKSDSDCIRVFKSGSPGSNTAPLSYLYSLFVQYYPLVLSDEVLIKEVPYPGGNGELEFYVEGLRFPDKDFDGLITINLSLLDSVARGIPETPIFTDRVVFKVAPWIMTPNTLRPVEVYVCKIRDNEQFLQEMKNITEKSGCTLKILPEYKNRGDRWIQDEMEFGYSDAPHHQFPVVLDSPRDRKLGDFAYDELLGPDFGYVTRTPDSSKPNSLDSFGNLEVSPPVTVNGKHYPLGRILIGVAFPTTTTGRNMTQIIQDFLWAQKVQDPVALYSDWLLVGHVDEFMSFVPAPDRKGFRLLLASPDAGYKLFKKLQNDGHGKSRLFEDLEEEKKLSVDEILADEGLQAENNYVQSCIDWNRDVLKRELGLEDADIIDLPILFQLVLDGKKLKALPFYPDMVNMIVLGKNLGIPKPFGPKVNGSCAIEAETRSLLEGLGLSCTFIDDFVAYHKKLGEVHCGSNTRRVPFDFKWWNMEM
ncbi:protein-arginine deiminase type-2-like isoform X2 [Cheilinus undulatus]|uniref:protein-arginine deiminase type-2-like isoform X2 n=1 Tax=Cheilinus undulatus TaxID=241271 RepID=UPI001BD4DB2A|nr:protein-arginine deiminase type-2-like isoform X2 [Cheilinus undulatus]